MIFENFQTIKEFFEKNRSRVESKSEWFRVEDETYRITLYSSKIVLENENDVRSETPRVVYYNDGRVVAEKKAKRRNKK